MSGDMALGTNDQEPEEYVELDGIGRYGRYNTLLRSDSGPLKKIYEAFDEYRGIKVAWTCVELGSFQGEPKLIDWVLSEVRLWKKFDHENVVAYYKVWKDEKRVAVNFISEICPSGSLRDYRKKYRRISPIALKRWLKKWSKQILEGLNYLHSQDPCVIHYDLTCSNIYVNGSASEIKLGDPGFSALIEQFTENTESFVGTPEFTAPELLSKVYTETVDIYSFGMCLIELATLEIPYSECKNDATEIRERASKGIKPEALSKVTDPEIKAIIEKCIADPIDRPSASELLNDPFFES